MKTFLSKSVICAVSIVALTLGTTRLQAAQPEMNDAIEQLEKAKHAEHPMEHLEKAKLHLEEAEHNKRGERVEAIHQVNEAIEAHRKGEHKLMEEHIDFAIKEIREGKHEARPRK